MICMNRNKQTFWYALFNTSTVQYDENGNETSEELITYATPVQMSANISEATGQSNIEQFGNLEEYDKIIVTSDMNCPIDENTVLFIDCEPNVSQESTRSGGNESQSASAEPVRLKYDYIVKRVSKSLNSISIACSKVKVG